MYRPFDRLSDLSCYHALFYIVGNIVSAAKKVIGSEVVIKCYFIYPVIVIKIEYSFSCGAAMNPAFRRRTDII